MIRRHLQAAGLGAAMLLVASLASARGIIKQPGNHEKYSFEAEPHLALASPVDPFGVGGPGFRGTIPILDNGFIKTINNSVGIGFGLDYFAWNGGRRYSSWCGSRGYYGYGCYHDGTVWIPVVLQWNFFLHEKWSVFAEAGPALRFYRYYRGSDYIDPFVFFAGGRFHFTKDVALTMRLGYPVGFTVGVSFFL